MYCAHYGLQKKPFDSVTDPDHLWISEKHRKALVYLGRSLSENNGFTVITGDVGNGKTAFVRRLVKSVDGSPIVVTIPDPDMEIIDFYNFVADALHLNQVFRSKGEFLLYFKRVLRVAASRGRRIFLIIDEAQRVGHELLQEIRLLLNIGLSLRMPLKPILVGLTELKTILQEAPNRNVKQRVIASFHLDPLTEREARAYIAHRLRIAGSPRIVFTPAALNAIHSHTAGCPRAINALCDQAMVTGYATGQQSIDTGIILECLQELSIPLYGGASELEAEAKAETSDERLQETATAAAGPAFISRPIKRFSPMHRSGMALALVFLLCLGGYLFHGQLFDPAPSKSENELAVQQFADILELQSNDTGQRSFSDHPFGHQMAEDAAAADIVEDPQLTEASGLDPLVIRKKIELPAAETGEGFKDLDR